MDLHCGNRINDICSWDKWEIVGIRYHDHISLCVNRISWLQGGERNGTD